LGENHSKKDARRRATNRKLTAKASRASSEGNGSGESSDPCSNRVSDHTLANGFAYGYRPSHPRRAATIARAAATADSVATNIVSAMGRNEYRPSRLRQGEEGSPVGQGEQ